MTYPSFSSGEVLTAADMNAVGLWLIKTQTVGTAVSSVEVTGAFSSTYDAYIITDTGGTMTADTVYSMTVGSTVANYYYFLTYGSFASNTVLGDNGNNTTKWQYAGGGSNRSGYIVVLNPNIAKPTDIMAKVRYATVYGTQVGHLSDSNQYTSFKFTPLTGTMSGGTIRVYGYRN